MAAEPIAVCAECGHPRSYHYGLGFQASGFRACMAQIDTRHPSVGGDTLSPCQCSGFKEVASAD